MFGNTSYYMMFWRSELLFAWSFEPDFIVVYLLTKAKKNYYYVTKVWKFIWDDKKSDYKLTSSTGEVFCTFCLQAREMKSTSLKFSSWRISGQSKVMRVFCFCFKYHRMLIFSFGLWKIFTIWNFFKSKYIPSHKLPLTLDQTTFYSSFRSLLKDITYSQRLPCLLRVRFLCPMLS